MCRTITVNTNCMGTLKVRFSESMYREDAVLGAVHELCSEFPSILTRVDGHYEVTVSDLRDTEQEAAVRLWLSQLVNDGEIRSRLDSSLGRIRDVVIAAAFSKIVFDEHAETGEKPEGVE